MFNRNIALSKHPMTETVIGRTSNYEGGFRRGKKVSGKPRFGAIASAIKVGGMKNQKAAESKLCFKRVRKDYGSYRLRGIER